MHPLLDGLRWGIAFPAMLIFGVCLAGNWATVIGGLVATLRSGQGRSGSFILPFVGPLLGVLFFLAVPATGYWRWFWVPVALDPIVVLTLWTGFASAVMRLGGRPGA
jgi:hypothetical protein